MRWGTGTVGLGLALALVPAVALPVAAAPAPAVRAAASAASASSSAAPAAAGGDACAAGRRQARTDPAGAEAALTTLAAQPDPPACAAPAAKGVAALLQAERLAAAGQPDAANTAVAAAYAADPLLPVPRFAQAETAFAHVRALRTAGMHDAAVAALRQAVGAYPTATIPPDLRHLADGGTTSMGRAAFQVERAGPKVPYALAVVLGALLALALLVPLVWRMTAVVGRAGWRVLAGRPPTSAKLVIGDFRGSADGDAQEASALAASLRSELLRLASQDTIDRVDLVQPGTDAIDPVQPGTRAIDLVQPGGEAVDLGAAVVAPLPEGQAIQALLRLVVRVWPTRRRIVRGQLLPPRDGSPGVALSLERERHGITAARNLFVSDLDLPPGPDDAPVDGVYALAGPAAAWTVLALRPDARLLDTRIYDSYLAFAAGAAWQQRGDLDRARLAYRRSLAADPDNRAAALNLIGITLS